jgi:hypothetical protein
MKSSVFLACGVILPVITNCGSSSATENVGTRTSAIEPGDSIQDCSSGGNTCSITYPQIYCSADGETHFQKVTVPPTSFQTNLQWRSPGSAGVAVEV